MLDSYETTEVSKAKSLIDPQQSSPITSPTASLPPHFDAFAQTDNYVETNTFELFFKSIQHPSFIIDLNMNSLEAKPHVLNPAAFALVASCNKDFFTESHLETFDGSVSDFIYSVKRKVAQKVTHSDILHTSVKCSSRSSEATFNFTATTIDLGNDSKILSILLMEVPKVIKQELSALESFKASLTCALSHELNTPMNSLIPLLKMMPSSTNGEIKEDMKEVALASAKLLQNKIRDFIDYARIEVDSIKVELSQFYVDDLFEELRKVFKFEVKQKLNSLVTKIHTNRNRRMVVLADRNRVEQVLVQLISNANKYTNKGHIYLTAAESKDDFNVIFSVKDTGAGISKKLLDLIFAPLPEKAKHLGKFARLPGLGLEIANGLCKYMESKLEVTSEEGKGSTFSFEIPACRITTFEDVLVPNIVIEEEKPRGVTNPPSFTKLNDLAPPKDTPRFKELITLIQEKEDKVPPMPGEKSVGALDKNIILERCESSKKIPSPVLEKRIGKTRFRKKVYNKMRTISELPINQQPLLESDLDISEEEVDVYKLVPQYKSFIRHGHSVERQPFETFESAVTFIPAKKKKNVVLITDDLYSNRMVIREMLKRIKVPVIEAINGKEAVREVEKSFQNDSPVKIELILMDLNMPVMNGIEATVEIRNLEGAYTKDTEIPIVAVTAHDATNDKNGCFEAGMYEYILKPIDSRTLFRIVKKYAPKTMGI